MLSLLSLSLSLSSSLSCFAAAQQYDGVFVCGCPESRSVEAALYQTLTPVQVSLHLGFSFELYKVERKQLCSVAKAYVTVAFSHK